MNDMELTEEIESIVHGLVAQQAMQDDWWRPRLDAVIAALRRGPERPPSGEMVPIAAWFYAYTSLGCDPDSAEKMVRAEIANYAAEFVAAGLSSEH